LRFGAGGAMIMETATISVGSDMVKQSWIWLFVFVAAGGLMLRADEPKAPPRADADFTGKVVFVHVRGGVKNATLEKAAVRPLGGRPFLVGKAIDDGGLTGTTYFTGAEVWVPVDEIQSLAVYDNIGHLKRATGH
jgi:hypothetical protein